MAIQDSPPTAAADQATGNVVPFRRPAQAPADDAPADSVYVAPADAVPADAPTVPAQAAPEPATTVPVRTDAHGVPELGDDLAGDTPLTPAWVKTRQGWKHRTHVARRRRVRAMRHWARRQRTTHGHAAQFARGLRRTHAWVRGTEGVQAMALQHAAHAAAKDAEAAQRAVRWAILPTKKNAAAKAQAEAALTQSVAAVRAYESYKSTARGRRLTRGTAAVLGPVAATWGAMLVEGDLGLAAAILGFAGLSAFLGRRTFDGTTYYAGATNLGDGDPLTDEMIQRVFTEVGLLKDNEVAKLVTPCTLDGEAWRAVIDMPVPYETVRKKAVEIAGAFGISAAQLDIAKVDRENRMSVWAADRDPFLKAKASPLISRLERVNAWRDGIPMAFSKRGEIIYATISDYSYLLAGATRSGKGMGVVNILAGALLDPRINIRLFDGKGTGEYVPLAPGLATFVRRNPRRLLAFLRVMCEEMDRRAEILVERGLSKATEELLAELGGIELVVVDELATYTAKKGRSAEFAEEIVELLAQLAAAGAACGIVLVLATQVPEVEIVPSRLRTNCAARWAMRTESADGSNVILGKGKAGEGYDSSKIGISKDQRGRGWLFTPDTSYIEARSLFIDESKQEMLQVLGVALKLRAAEGSLPGHFADPVETELRRTSGASSVAGGKDGKGGIVIETVKDHVLAAIKATGRGNVTKAELFAYLAAEIDPGRFTQLTGEADAAYASRAGKALAQLITEQGYDFPEKKVDGPTGRVMGFTLADVTAARLVQV